MNSNYILPVSIAAAVHAAVLFGVAKSPSRPPVLEQPVRVDRFELKLNDPEIIEVSEPSGEKTASKENPVAPPARQPEPLVPVTGDDILITPPRIDPNVTPGDSAFIPDIFPGPGSGPGGGIGPVMPAELDNSPRTRFQTAPHYPTGAKTAGLTGEVLVEFTVDESGRVLDPHVTRSTDRVFEEPTLRAVAKWQFEPGRRAGRIVRFRMAVPVVFNLNE